MTDPRVRRRFSIEEKILEKEGLCFSVQTENEIRKTSNLNSIKQIYPYRRYKVASVLREMVLVELSKGPTKGYELIKRIPGLEEKNLFSLVTNSIISVRYEGKIGAMSIFFLFK
jgi:hypothetical protein